MVTRYTSDMISDADVRDDAAIARSKLGLLDLSSYSYRKQVTVRSPFDCGVGQWVHLYLTDPVLVARVADGGDLRVTDDTETTILQHKMISATATLVVILVELVRPATATDITLYVYAGDSANAAQVLRSWGPTTQAAPGAKLAMSFTTGMVIDPTDESIHPNVLRVPTGNWMKSNGAGGVVTHVMVDTPIPGGDDDYENPSLMYSDDEGATWAEWPGTTNPIVPFPGGVGNYNSDPCLAIRSDGSLHVAYRQSVGGTTTMKYVIVSGDNLTDNVVVGAQQTATMPTTQRPASPTIYKVSDSLWYMFGAEYASGGVVPKDIRRWTSADQGATWTDETTVILKGGEKISGWWHGGQVIALGDYYYAAWGEYHTGAEATYSPRLFRSDDLLTWEACTDLLMDTLPAWIDNSFYEHCLYLTTDNQVNLIFSGSHTAGNARFIGRLVVPALETNRTVTSAVAFGYGHGTIAETLPTEVAMWDCVEGPNAGHNDLSANSHHLEISAGVPIITPGVGLDFTGNSESNLQRMKTADNLKLSGLTSLTVFADVTLPDPLPSIGIILADNGGATRAFMLYVRSDGEIRANLWGAGGSLSARSTAGVVSAGERIQILYQYKTNFSSLYINGVFKGGGSSDMGAIIDSTGALYFGAYLASFAGLYYPFAGIIHRLRIASTAPMAYGSFGPSEKWETGRQLI